MNKRAALALVLAAAASPALAQYGGRRRGGSGGSDRQGRPDEKEAPERVNALEVTLHELHEDLKLTAQQEPLWQSYADKVRALADDVSRERARKPAPASLVQQIDRQVDAARNRLTALEDIAQSAKALYASLSPEQQPAADPRLANLMTIPLAQAQDTTRGRRDR
jgi:periplasmic protein CpxP/Spy